MNLNLEAEMIEAWEDWHSNIPKGDLPSVSLEFKKGFHVACNLLLPLLEQSDIHIAKKGKKVAALSKRLDKLHKETRRLL